MRNNGGMGTVWAVDSRRSISFLPLLSFHAGNDSHKSFIAKYVKEKIGGNFWEKNDGKGIFCSVDRKVCEKEVVLCALSVSTAKTIRMVIVTNVKHF